MTQQQVADLFGVTKATVSAWETGTGDPGVYRLRELSRLYSAATDAILWEDSLSPDSMRFAAEFDSLSERQRSTFRAVWMAYVREAATDSEVETKMPVTKPLTEDK
jgi:transcriptional regulator with XRE-family HTH domain